MTSPAEAEVGRTSTPTGKASLPRCKRSSGSTRGYSGLRATLPGSKRK